MTDDARDAMALVEAAISRKNLWHLFLDRDQLKKLLEVQQLLEGCQGGGQAAEALLQGAVVRVKCRQAHHLYVIAGSFRDAAGNTCLGLRGFPGCVKPQQVSTVNPLHSDEAYARCGRQQVAELKASLRRSGTFLLLHQVAATAWRLKVSLSWADRLERYLPRYGAAGLLRDLQDPARIREMAVHHLEPRRAAQHSVSAMPCMPSAPSVPSVHQAQLEQPATAALPSSRDVSMERTTVRPQTGQLSGAAVGTVAAGAAMRPTAGASAAGKKVCAQGLGAVAVEGGAAMPVAGASGELPAARLAAATKGAGLGAGGESATPATVPLAAAAAAAAAASGALSAAEAAVSASAPAAPAAAASCGRLPSCIARDVEDGGNSSRLPSYIVANVEEGPHAAGEVSSPPPPPPALPRQQLQQMQNQQLPLLSQQQQEQQRQDQQPPLPSQWPQQTPLPSQWQQQPLPLPSHWQQQQQQQQQQPGLPSQWQHQQPSKPSYWQQQQQPCLPSHWQLQQQQRLPSHWQQQQQPPLPSQQQPPAPRPQPQGQPWEQPQVPVGSPVGEPPHGTPSMCWEAAAAQRQQQEAQGAALRDEEEAERVQQAWQQRLERIQEEFRREDQRLVEETSRKLQALQESFARRNLEQEEELAKLRGRHCSDGSQTPGTSSESSAVTDRSRDAGAGGRGWRPDRDGRAREGSRDRDRGRRSRSTSRSPCSRDHAENKRRRRDDGGRSGHSSGWGHGWEEPYPARHTTPLPEWARSLLLEGLHRCWQRLGLPFHAGSLGGELRKLSSRKLPCKLSDACLELEGEELLDLVFDDRNGLWIDNLYF